MSAHRLLLLLVLFAASCATAPIPRPRVATDADVDALLPQLSNWGRWGAGDQLGTLNYITAAAVRDARKLVTEGRTVGLPLVDNADLDELARVCAARKRWEFLLVIAPWRLTGATSSPVNPIAVY